MFPPCPSFTIDYALGGKVVPVLSPSDQTFLVGLQVPNRADLAPAVQSIITKYGDNIMGRFGLPSPDKEKGLIVLLMQEAAAVDRLTADLAEMADLQIRTVAFD